MKIHDCQQNTPEWWELHRGRPTASHFHKIITPLGSKSAGQEGYIHELIGSLHQLGPIEGNPFMTRAMRRGAETEAEARRWFTFETGSEVRQVGFCETDDGRFGCSPDGLLYDDGVGGVFLGGLELKCPTLKIQTEYLLDGKIPPRYVPQVHGCLAVTGAPCWHFLSYAIGLQPLLIRVEPNEYTMELRVQLEIFWEKYQAALKKIRGIESD